MRPKGITDLQTMWAIKDISCDILDIKLKSVLYSLVALIGNSKREWFFKSHEGLADFIGISARRLPKLLNQLEALGFISINRPATYTKKDTNEYKLNYQKILSTGQHFREQRVGGRSVR